jgi:hypothetical protein
LLASGWEDVVRLMALLATVVTASAPMAAFAQTSSMVCRFEPRNMFFGTTSPGGDENRQPSDRYCPVRLTRSGSVVTGEELCPGMTIQKAFKGTVVANPAYSGNVIVLWTDQPSASASLWAISFERREVGVSYAFSAQFTEVGAQWLKCSAE